MCLECGGDKRLAAQSGTRSGVMLGILGCILLGTALISCCSASELHSGSQAVRDRIVSFPPTPLSRFMCSSLNPPWAFRNVTKVS